MTLFVRRTGIGPPVVLVHGGLPARWTWDRQQELATEWRLLIPSRRGFAPSPAATRQDLLADAADLEQLVTSIPGGVHLAGFSYGGLGTCLAAARQPAQVRSLTLIEAPLWTAAGGDESVRRLAAVADRFTSAARDASTDEAFYAMAGIDHRILDSRDGEMRQAMTLAGNFRSPWEANPEFDRIVEAGIPVLVVSGDNNPAMEVVCDAVARRLGTRHVCLPGAGHAAQRAPGFNDVFVKFLTAAEKSCSNRGVVV